MCLCGRTVFLAFSDTIGFAMGDDRGLDEHFENLSRSKLPVLYGLDNLQTWDCIS